MSHSAREALKTAWAGLSQRERRIALLTFAMSLGLVFKLAVWDPSERSLAAAQSALESKQKELTEARAQTAKIAARAKSAGGLGAREELERWRARSQELDRKIGALSSTMASGPEALELLDALARAAGPGLRELSIPEPMKDGVKARPEAAGYEHRIQMTMAGSWEEHARALERARAAAPALRLRRVSISLGSKGESVMKAEFAALSLDPSWQLPGAADKPAPGAVSRGDAKTIEPGKS